MPLDDKKKVTLNGAILLFSCFFSAVFSTIQLSEIATKETTNAAPCNTYGSRVKAAKGADTKLSTVDREWRDRPPNAYCVQIEGCSALMNNKYPNVKKYESRPFNVGGFNWTLIIEPFGATIAAKTMISSYVAIDPSGLVGENREVYAKVRFLVFSKSRDQYFTLGDTDITRFRQFQTTWGVPDFILHSDLPGYFIFDNNQCVFGVDISVYPYFNIWEVFSIDQTNYEPRSWKLMNISTLTRDFYISDEFSVGGKTWAFKVYPNGNGTGEENSLSLYLILSEDQSLKPYEKVLVRAKLRVLDQNQSHHLERQIVTWFNTTGEASGFEQFVSFTDLRIPAKGFIVNDALVVQVQFDTVSSTSFYSENAANFITTF